MKICPMTAELFHTNGDMDRQTDMMKLIVPFPYFVNTPTEGPDWFQNANMKEQMLYLIIF
jgi:hypothetical protein